MNELKKRLNIDHDPELDKDKNPDCINTGRIERIYFRTKNKVLDFYLETEDIFQNCVILVGSL